jgi:cytochrome b561
MHETIAAPVLTARRYDRVAMFLHWTVAAFVVFVGALGLSFDLIPRATRPFWINIHTTVGLVMFGFILMRLLWRVGHPAPPPNPGWSRPVVLLSHVTHMALYALMIILPIIGIIAYAWHGRVFDFGLFKLDFGVASQKSVYGPAEDIHQMLAYALMGLVGLHVLGAFWHHFIARDGIFARILPIRERGLEKP